MEAEIVLYATVEENVGNRKVEVVSLAFNCSMVCNVAACRRNEFNDDDKLAVCR